MNNHVLNVEALSQQRARLDTPKACLSLSVCRKTLDPVAQKSDLVLTRCAQANDGAHLLHHVLILPLCDVR